MKKSKRFLVLIISLVIYVVLLIIVKLDAISLATGLTLLVSPYLAAETIRQSNTKKPE